MCKTKANTQVFHLGSKDGVRGEIHAATTTPIWRIPQPGTADTGLRKGNPPTYQTQAFSLLNIHGTSFWRNNKLLKESESNLSKSISDAFWSVTTISCSDQNSKTSVLGPDEAVKFKKCAWGERRVDSILRVSHDSGVELTGGVTLGHLKETTRQCLRTRKSALRLVGVKESTANSL